jgi:hypoxanthine-DNA glycosylase
MREIHPYGEFIPNKPRAMIIGSFPIGKFTNPDRRSEIKSHEHDFFFGGEKNLLWKLLGEVFGMKVNTRENIVKLLSKYHLAIGDVIISCRRKNHGASDSDLYDIEWNHNLLEVLNKNQIAKVYFTSKKVETWFHRLFPEADHLETITLISPSAQSVRSLTKRVDFKSWLMRNPTAPKFDFILMDYKKKFQTML